MPKWTEYTTKDTLADNDEVMLYDATARANKRGLMSKFWDYVVDKMATAVISKLETNNKTIIGAINALHSNLDDRIGVDKKFTSGTLLNIINQMSNGIHMALVGETVSGIPFSNTENYIIVFKGTSYGNPYTRIMVFPMSKSSAPKWGMVSWDNSKIVWA